MKVRAGIAATLGSLLLVVLAACGDPVVSGPTSQTTDRGDAAVGGMASCALAVRYQGFLYEGWTVRVAPREGAPVGKGVLPRCDDGGGAGSREEIELAEVAGVSPEVALIWRGQTDTVFVREGATPPPEVERLLRAPTCDPRDEPIDLSGPWLGILGADGNTELDLESPYDVDLFVEASSAPAYERAFLTVRVPRSLEKPLARDDVKSSLWEGGTIELRARCGDDGGFVAEDVVAHAPR